MLLFAPPSPPVFPAPPTVILALRLLNAPLALNSTIPPPSTLSPNASHAPTTALSAIQTPSALGALIHMFLATITTVTNASLKMPSHAHQLHPPLTALTNIIQATTIATVAY